MQSKLNKIRALLTDLNSAELATLRSEIEEIAPYAPAPTPEEELLAPGHYFEERVVSTGKNRLTYLYERWYERDGSKLIHKGRLLHKGSKAEFIRATRSA